MSAPKNDELTRMALTSLEPRTLDLIKRRAEEVIRGFDGAPENVPEFQEAQRILQIMATMDDPR